MPRKRVKKAAVVIPFGTETLYCYPCNMTFRVENAPKTAVAETTHCRDCGRVFWHAGLASGFARVGVWPENVAEVA